MSEREIIFYDGDCGFCHRWVRFVLSHDLREDGFLFSPRQSSFYQENVPDEFANAETMVVKDAKGNFLGRSSAVAYILIRLGGVWAVAGKILQIIPRVIRDTGYRFVSKIRKKLVAAPDDICPIVPEKYRERFMRD